jgi:2-polyprenyl-3-methyl-5-hydroxy-6-metoxy-1,4-benzoquinol methylase
MYELICVEYGYRLPVLNLSSMQQILHTMTQEKMSSEVTEIERRQEQEEKRKVQQHQKSSALLVELHYTRRNLENTILIALGNAGKNIDQLTVDDLAPIDEFHTRGRETTANLASLLNNLQPNLHVLDVGAGIGGPSRYLASRFGCHVTGLDLVGEYCNVADSLAKKVKLDSLLSENATLLKCHLRMRLLTLYGHNTLQ